MSRKEKPIFRVARRHGISADEVRQGLARHFSGDHGGRKCYSCDTKIEESRKDLPRFYRKDFCKKCLPTAKRELHRLHNPEGRLFAKTGG